VSASVAINQPSRLTAEAVARARDFRRRVEAEDQAWLQVIRDAFRPINERIERKPGRPLRPEHMSSLAQRWRLAPAGFRVNLQADLNGSHGAIRERRLGIGHHDEADLAEPGCSVVEMSLTADRAGVRRHAVILTTFSLFALSARFVRSESTDDRSVVADLAAVAEVDLAQLGPAGGGVRIGSWRGRLATIEDSDHVVRRVVHVGTWASGD
jgi:hypothetical protein